MDSCVCARTDTRGCPDLFPQDSSSAALPELGDEGGRGEGETKHPHAGAPLTSSCSKCAGMGLPCFCSSAAVRGRAGPGAGGRLALVGSSPGELCGSGRRVRRYLRGAACLAAGGAGLCAPRPPGDPLSAARMRGVSAEGGESRRGPGSRRSRGQRRGGAGRGAGGRKDAEEEEDDEGQALS